MKTMDKKDQKLLLELYKDGRASLTELASRVGISKEVAHYRLKKLQEEKILLKVVPIIDLSAIGYNINRLQILLTKEGKARRKELEAEFRKLNNLSWLVELSGQWDYALLFSTNQNTDFVDIYEDFLVKYGKYIDSKLFANINSITHLPPTHIIGGERLALIQKIKPKSFTLDGNQNKIVAFLEEDGRTPLLEMAKKMKVSVTTIKYHLQVLEKKKIILAYKPLINNDFLGYEQFKVMLELSDLSLKSKLNELLINNPNVVYITHSLGKYDLEFECQHKNTRELLNDITKLEEQVGIKKYDIIFTNQEIVVNAVPDN